MHIIYLVIIAFLMIYSQKFKYCDEYHWERFDYRKLDNSWVRGDSAEVKSWIESLSDTTLCEIEFHSRLSELSGVTGFCYGNADLTENYYWTISPKIRKIKRMNIAKVYIEYTKSKCFMSKVFEEESEIEIQHRYYADSSEIDGRLLGKIRLALDSIYQYNSSTNVPVQ